MSPLPREEMPKLGTWISKDQLVDGAYYAGECRNAHIARWSAEHGCFFHWRSKFGSRYVEKIKAPEDESNWDVFVAKEKLQAYIEYIPFTVDA